MNSYKFLVLNHFGLVEDVIKYIKHILTNTLIETCNPYIETYPYKLTLEDRYNITKQTCKEFIFSNMSYNYLYESIVPLQSVKWACTLRTNHVLWIHSKTDRLCKAIHIIRLNHYQLINNITFK